MSISKVRHVVSVNFAKVVEQSRVSNRVNRSSLLEILLQKRARMRIRSTATTINVKRLCITIHASRERRFTAGARERDPPSSSAAWKIMFLEILGSTFPDINHRLLRAEHLQQHFPTLIILTLLTFVYSSKCIP